MSRLIAVIFIFVLASGFQTSIDSRRANNIDRWDCITCADGKTEENNMRKERVEEESCPAETRDKDALEAFRRDVSKNQ